jgi:single-strand DNA-binding protein
MDPDLLIRRTPMTNLVILTGRIARDPETRTTQGGTSITSISVVTDRPARNKEGKTYKDESGYTAKDSEFHRVTCFNGLGKNVAQYCTKGQLVSVQGRIHYTQWEDQDGVKRYGCEILADSVDFLTKGRANGNNEDAPPIDD